MDIRRLKKLIKSMPSRNDKNGYKYLVVASDEAKAELEKLVERLPEDMKNDVVVMTEAENASAGLGAHSSGFKGQNRTSGWEDSTYQFAADNGEIV